MASAPVLICRHCKVVLDENTWSKYYRKKNNRICRKCVAETSRKAYWEDPEAKRKKYREQYADHIGAKEKAERDEMAEKKAEAEEAAFQQHLKSVKTTDLAWATGLWEAEGSAERRYHSTYVAKDGTEHKYYAPRLRVANNDRSLLERFKEIVGGLGAISFGKTTTAGNDSFEYGIYGDDAIRVALVLWPYIISNYRHGQIGKMVGEKWSVIDGYKIHEEKLAWVAGIHEGEGCAGVYLKRRNAKNGGCWVAEVNIANTQYDILDAIKRIIGFGNVYHSGKDREKYETYTQLFQYGLSAMRARKFASTVLPYVYSEYKRKQLLKVLCSEKQSEPNIGSIA